MLLSVASPHAFIATAFAALLVSCRVVSSWVLPPTILPAGGRNPGSVALAGSDRPGIFFEDELECPNEDECEIDWDSMPGFDDNDGDSENHQEAGVAAGAAIETAADPDDEECPDEEECEIDWSKMPGFADDDDDEQQQQQNEPAESLSVTDSDDPECPDEEECDIDWSKMPGFADDDDDENEAPSEARTPDADYRDPGEELGELEPREAYVRRSERSIEKSRLHMEMNWQIDDCAVDEDTCTDACAECAGTGRVVCPFCSGRGTVFFGNEIRACILCEDGLVGCKACAGTGRIASWAKTHDGPP